MRTHVQRQIEEIADTTDGALCRVIVQMQPPPDVAHFLAETSKAVAQQRQAITARALLPPPANRIGGNTPTRLTAQRIRSHTPGVSRTLIAGNLQSQSNTQVRTDSEVALAELTTSEFYRKASEKRPSMAFPVAASAALSIGKAELRKMAEALPGIGAVFPSRITRVPPMIRKDGAPPKVVTDSPGHTWGVGRTGALACWGAFGMRGAGVRVAVLDTGVDRNHPDLQGKIADFAEFDEHGRIVPGRTGEATAYDDGTHGTHVSGTIVGGQASKRWIGMAPDARILSALVLKGGYGTSEQILAGMQWAVDQQAHVINMSLGGLDMNPEVFDTYTLAILNASRMGIPVVAAIGNEGAGTSGAPGSDLFALAVGASDVEDRAAGFSGGRTQIIRESRYIRPEYLPLPYTKPDLAAPGVDIYSSVPNGGWDTYSGTSMATPHVAGALALLLSSTPGGGLLNLVGRQRVDILSQLLTGTVKELGEAGQDHRFGHGRLDVLRAVGYAQELGYL